MKVAVVDLSEDACNDVVARIEAQTGLTVLNLPKEETFHVGLHFPV